MKSSRFAIVAAIGMACAASARAGIVGGQIDDFQDGTIMAWSGGALLSNIATGGPAGAGDKYLEVESFGSIGPGSRLATFNLTQWSGDYLSQGVYGISADVRNYSSAGDLELRLMLFSPAGGTFTSTFSVNVPNDGVWHNVFFGLSAFEMTAVTDGFDLDLTLGAVERILIRHQPGAPGGQGDAPVFTGTMGLDNIEALVPEPATLALLSFGCLLIIRRRS